MKTIYLHGILAKKFGKSFKLSVGSTKEGRITTAQQTATNAQNAVASVQSELTAKFDSLAVGGRNYLLNSDFATTKHDGGNLRSQSLAMSNAIKMIATPCTLTVSAHFKLQNVSELANDVRMLFLVRFTHADGTVTAKQITYNAKTRTDIDKRLSAQVGITKPITGFAHTYIDVYGITAEMASIARPQIELGTIATDWTPAPEDTQSQLDEKASTATLNEFKQTSANADTALGERITAIDTAYKQADTANAQRTANDAVSRANTANSAITAEQKARADADSSLASQITALDTAYKSADSQLSGRITTAQQTATNAQNAVATAQSQLNARFNGLAVGGRNLLKNSSLNIANTSYGHRFELTVAPNVGDDVIVTLWGDMGADRTGIGVYNTHGYTELFRLVKIADGIYQGKGQWRKPVRNGQELTPNDTHLNVYFYPNNATSQNRIERIKLEKGNIATDWTPAPEDTQSQLDEKASTATLDEFKRTQAQKDTATAQAVQTLQTTVQGQTASIQQHAQSLNGLSAQYTIKVQTGGVVAGIGLASNNGVSDFAVRADKFYIAPPTGTGKGDTPFTVLTSPQVINGVQVPAGTYIKSAFIQDGSITNAKIANASIDNAKIANGSIDNAKIANGSIDTAKIRDGVITTAKIGVAQIDTLQIAGEAVTVPRMQYNAGIRHFTQGGEIELGRMTMNSQGGNVMITIGFARLFSVPNGIYSWGKFVPAVEDNDFHNFAHIHANNMTGVATGDISFHVRRNDVEIHRVVFKPNYAKSGTSAITSVSRVDPILLYDQYTMPYILDTPPAGDNVYTIVMTVHSNRVYSNSDRTIERQTRLTGFSFMALGVKR